MLVVQQIEGDPGRLRSFVGCSTGLAGVLQIGGVPDGCTADTRAPDQLVWMILLHPRGKVRKLRCIHEVLHQGEAKVLEIDEPEQAAERLHHTSLRNCSGD